MDKNKIDATLGGALITGLGASLLLGMWSYALPLGFMLWKFSGDKY